MTVTVYTGGASVEVIARQPAAPIITGFAATPGAITVGQSSTLDATVANATTIELDGVVIPGLPHVVAPTSTRDYTLRAIGAAGTTPAQQTLTVTVNAVAALIPAFGSGMVTDHFNCGPADWIDTAQFPKAPVPWTNYHDATKWILAPSCNGVRPTATREINLYGSRTWLYNHVPMLQNGRHRQWNPEVYSGDDYASITPRVRDDPAPAGVRGRCISDPYCTVRGHPTSASTPGPLNTKLPLFVGVDAVGRMLYWMPNGDIVLAGQVPGVADVHDFAFYEPNRALFFVADAANKRIVKVDRTAAIAARVSGQFEDSALWTFSTFAGGFQKPTSIETLANGRIFVCDEQANAIVELDANGARVNTVTATAPFWARRLSTGELVIATLGGTVHLFDTVTVGPNLRPSPQGAQWVNVAVDEYGTFGPKDEWAWTESHGSVQSSNVSIIRFRNRGAQVITAPPWGATSMTTLGDSSHAGEWFHYGWMLCYHPDQAVMWVQGFANSYPAIVRPKLAIDAAEEAHDHYLFRQGQELIKAGTTLAYQQANGNFSRPSLTALIETTGWSLLGTTADWYVQQAKANGWAWLETFIQSGMGGSTPRPEFVGRDLYALMYWLCKSSQQYLSEGATLIASMKAYIQSKYPAAIGAALSLPVVPKFNDGSSTFLRAAKFGAQIVVTPRDAWGNPKTVAPPASLSVVFDEDRPGEKTVALSSSWSGALPTLSGGPHAVTCYAPGMYSEGSVIEVSA